MKPNTSPRSTPTRPQLAFTRITSTLIVLAVTFMITLTSPLTSKAHAAPQSYNNPGSAHLSACLQNAKTVSALFVFDMSGSIAVTDPTGIRYDGLEMALTELAELKRSDDEELAVEVAVAGFDNTYLPSKEVTPWTRIDTDSEKAINTVVDAARDKTRPRGGTNFEAAIDGISEDLANRNAPNTCRIAFWMTDGAFTDAEGTMDQALARMCQKDGKLDKLRDQDITLVGSQLGSFSEQLKPMSLGSADGKTCGTTPIPEGHAPGMYLQADDAAGLKRMFRDLIKVVDGCTSLGTNRTIDPGIRRFRVDVHTTSKASQLKLTPPNAAAFTASTSGTATHAGGYSTNSIADDDYVSMEVSLPAGAASGEWRVDTGQALATDDVSFCVFHDLHLALAPNQDLKGGEKSSVTLQVLDRDNQPAALTDYQDVTASAAGRNAQGAPLTASGQVSDKSVLVDVTTAQTDARIELDAQVQLKTASGVQLTPLKFTKAMAVSLSSLFPVITPRDELVLQDAIKEDPASGAFTLTGSPDGPTKVCFGAAQDLLLPEETKTSTLSYTQGCVDLAANETKTVDVSITPTEATVGNGSAKIPVTLHSAAANGQPPVQADLVVPISWRFENPLNVVGLALVTIVLSILSAILPLLLLALCNKLAARYDVRGLRSATIPVNVTSRGLTRVQPMRGADSRRIIDTVELAPVPLSGARTKKKFTASGVTFDAHGSWNPAGGCTFWANAPRSHRILSTAGTSAADYLKAPTTAGLGFLACMTIADHDLRTISGPSFEVPATLVVFVRDSMATGEDLDALLLSTLSTATLDELPSQLDLESTPDVFAASGSATNSSASNSGGGGSSDLDDMFS